jgi:hypothetical protein
MDIYCPRCAEPYATDSLHDAAAEHGTTFDKVKKAFRLTGCAAIIDGPEAARPVCAVDRRAALVRATMDLSGDADDWASDLDGLF